MKPATGAELKSTGQQMALFNAGKPWTDDMIDKLRAFCKVRREMGTPEFLFEDFVAVVKQRGWPLPPSPNAFGALPQISARKGLIRFTGQYENAKSPKTRSHPVKKWVAI